MIIFLHDYWVIRERLLSVCVCLCIIIIGFVEMKTFSVNPLKAFQVWWWHLSSKKYWTNTKWWHTFYFVYKLSSLPQRHVFHFTLLWACDEQLLHWNYRLKYNVKIKPWLAPDLKPFLWSCDVFVWVWESSFRVKMMTPIRFIKRRHWFVLNLCLRCFHNLWGKPFIHYLIYPITLPCL